MGEIKSTLDIVLEKTKHLSLSKEEKEAQRNTEIRRSLKGMIRKFKDQTLKKEQFQKELEALAKTYDMSDKHILTHEIINEVDLDKDNTSMLFLLNDICGLDTGQIESLIKGYN